PGTKVIVEETVINPPTEPQNAEPPTVEQPAENLETRRTFEIPENAEFFVKPTHTTAETTPGFETSSIAEQFAEPPNESFENLETPEVRSENPIFAEESADEKTKYETAGTLFQSEVKPLSASETIRQSGMAYSAAIVLFGSVVFMMILGWFADLLLGSSPWGIVGGIILGGIVGFIQFFRITSQIFKK
ncbi:MAG TPA: hypothetical protein VNB22_14875, partial [Pyrinomonadaceae bacterium]|nr:hypothetical protein [Pyrinomonadaceae bacterium]